MAENYAISTAIAYVLDQKFPEKKSDQIIIF